MASSRHGAAWRALVVQFGTTDNAAATGATDEAAKPADAADCCHGNNYLWAELMRR